MEDNMFSTQRDIYASLQAGQLYEKGYYGIEVQLFACLFYYKNKFCPFITEDEELIYQYVFRAIKNNTIFTPVITKSWHIYESKITVEVLKRDMLIYLYESFPLNVQNHIINLNKCMNNNTAFLVLERYFTSLDLDEKILKNALLYDLIMSAKGNKRLYNDSTKFLLNYWIDMNKHNSVISDGKKYYGFAYKMSSDSWKYYFNCYLPMIIRKYLDYQIKGFIVSPIYVQNYEMNSQTLTRQVFLDELKFVFDDDVLLVIENLAGLPSPIFNMSFSIMPEHNVPRVTQQFLKLYETKWLM